MTRVYTLVNMKMSHQAAVVRFTDPEESSVVKESRSLMKFSCQ